MVLSGLKRYTLLYLILNHITSILINRNRNLSYLSFLIYFDLRPVVWRGAPLNMTRRRHTRRGDWCAARRWAMIGATVSVTAADFMQKGAHHVEVHATQGVALMVILGLCVLTGWSSSAEAVIVVRRAEVHNGVAVAQGGNAARSAPIYWEGALVTQANNGGNFDFQGVVPADCVGSLHEGDPAAAIAMALANCGPVSDAPAPVPQTGQTQCWDTAGALIPCAGTGQDGDIQAGVPFPSPRFTDQGNGTVRDNLTGLIWLKQDNCFVLRMTWAQALQAANALASGSCGLSDGSVAGDWRLPNVRELYSLINFGFHDPALSDGAGTGHWTEGNVFVGDPNRRYWTSTTRDGNHTYAWSVLMQEGLIDLLTKEDSTYVWPVRGQE
jgi:hypothetical protein